MTTKTKNETESESESEKVNNAVMCIVVSLVRVKPRTRRK